MRQEQQADVAVVGAGILGLAHAYAAAKQGRRVVLFERTGRAVGASVRNFGLIWPIGQPEGPLYRRAKRSRDIWLELAAEAGFWTTQNGSLLLAYHDDERDVLAEFVATADERRASCRLLSSAEVALKSPTARQGGLICGLWSSDDSTVDPREAVRRIPGWLAERYGVELRFDAAVQEIAMPVVETLAERWRVGQVYVCGGPEFESLYPDLFAASGITRCKLQMMRTVPQPENWRLGPSLAAGLTLRHYKSFAHCQALAALDARFDRENPLFKHYGIHVLLSQTRLGELTIGDSHEYGLWFEPFARAEIDRLILDYLAGFADIPRPEIAEHWQGFYAPVPGQSELIMQPEDGVTIVNGIGGNGMTLSFGLAEEVVAGAFRG